MLVSDSNVERINQGLIGRPRLAADVAAMATATIAWASFAGGMHAAIDHVAGFPAVPIRVGFRIAQLHYFSAGAGSEDREESTAFNVLHARSISHRQPSQLCCPHGPGSIHASAPEIASVSRWICASASVSFARSRLTLRKQTQPDCGKPGGLDRLALQ